MSMASVRPALWWCSNPCYWSRACFCELCLRVLKKLKPNVSELTIPPSCFTSKPILYFDTFDKQEACRSPGPSFLSLLFPTHRQVSICPTFKRHCCYVRLLVPSSPLLSAYSVFSFKWGHSNWSDLPKKKTNFSTSQSTIFWGYSTI